MNNKNFQQATKLIFALAMAVVLLLPASTTSALPQRAAPGLPNPIADPTDPEYKHVSPTTPPTDQWSYYGTWGIKAPMAWAITTGSGNSVVAVIDTGITSNDDLDIDDDIPSRIMAGYDFVGNDTNPDESVDCASSYPGTHVAGVIGATANNGIGIAGIDWNARILPVRVANCSGGDPSATAVDIVEGMLWAVGKTVTPAVDNPVANRAKVINVGVSAPVACTSIYQGATTYQAAIDQVLATGAVIVAAAGDTGVTGADAINNFPGNCTGVITVAATSAEGKRANYSNYGSTVMISAPGGGMGQGDVLSTASGTSYTGMIGTRMAAAHVSGVVSLMFAVNPRITNDQVIKILKKTAGDFELPLEGELNPCTTLNSNCGSGILDAGEAVRVANMPDLVITAASLSRNYPSLGDAFDVSITIKNQGGENVETWDHIVLNSTSVVYRQVFVGRDPSLITQDGDGCLLNDDKGEFQRTESNAVIASGDDQTFSVKINDPTPPLLNQWTENLPVAWGDGTHDLYVYADANCAVDEGFEDNNSFTKVTINPFIEGAFVYPENGTSIGTDYNPAFKWNKVTGATKYRLYLTKLGSAVTDQWFEATSVCSAVASTCSVELGPSLTLSSGDYSWYMQSYSPTGGNSTWSNSNFTITMPTVDLRDALTVPAHNAALGMNYNPKYTWKKVAGADYYRFYLVGSGGALLDKWYQASVICNDTTCSVQDATTVGSGTFSWYVMTWNPTGSGPWSLETKFTTTAPTVPDAVDLRNASTVPVNDADLGTINTPTFTWKKAARAAYYRLYVVKSGSTVVDTWYPATPSMCGVDTCSVASPALVGGSYSWYVMSWNLAGTSSWSQETKFSIAMQTVDLRDALTTPAHNATLGANYNPKYTWAKVAGADYYRLYLVGSSGALLDKWYQASTICNDTTCSVEDGPSVGGGTFSWYVMAWNPAGSSPWSLETKFTTTAPTMPDAVDLRDASTVPLNDADLGTMNTPTFTWKKAARAAYYRLYVVKSGSVVKDQWYPATASMCGTDTCSVVSPTLSGGAYSWYVMSWNLAGSSSWSQETKFSIAMPTVDLRDVLTVPAHDAVLGTNYNPKFTWAKVAGADYYRFYLVGSGGALLDKWYQASVICNDTTCSVEDGPALGGGIFSWYVMTWNPTGSGPWSLETKFTTTAPTVPEAVDLRDALTVPTHLDNLGPQYNPTFTWKKVARAAYYRLYMVKSGSTIVDTWYPATPSMCGDETSEICSLTSPTLSGGTYSWYVMSWNFAGSSSWSQETIFTVSDQTVPTAATNLSPTGGITVTSLTPTYTWKKVDMATWYHLYVKGPNGVVIDQWYQSTSAECHGNICSVVSPTLVKGNHTWWVQTYNVLGYGPWKSATFTVSP